jgi:hypothetical protein
MMGTTGAGARNLRFLAAAALAALAVLAAWRPAGAGGASAHGLAPVAWPWTPGRYTVAERMAQHGPTVERRLRRQVPEGIYGAESLNPNSRFHLSIRLNYPNAFDRRMARADRRTRLGGDIMIHGSAVSVGCLAMGDPAAEDLFMLAALVSPERVRVIISPVDFRRPGAAAWRPGAGQPAWAHTLYAALRAELRQFPPAAQANRPGTAATPRSSGRFPAPVAAVHP